MGSRDWGSEQGGREQGRIYPLPITHYPLPITHYPLPITHAPCPIPYSL
ncbi:MULTISPECIES: hypothetical protein [unclassified Tolypothrix]|nr:MULTISPECIES: hypothetical protein [unclassified Tolypothrix]EKE98736.1 hypothetical protein FDUTEX481_03814 [Tolypothrix sp. PCC 7601]UYD38096.1 hypothetical protein HG267_32120 [Tolypothrix sp. PCC 7601]